MYLKFGISYGDYLDLNHVDLDRDELLKCLKKARTKYDDLHK